MSALSRRKACWSWISKLTLNLNTPLWIWNRLTDKIRLDYETYQQEVGYNDRNLYLESPVITCPAIFFISTCMLYAV